MPLTTAERATFQSLTAELIQANGLLSDAQANAQIAIQVAVTRKEAAEANLDRFVNSVPVSDAPAEVKRGRPRGSKTRKWQDENKAPIAELLDNNVNAALSGTQGEPQK